MKRIKSIYWTCTILFGGFMVMTAIPNIMVDQASVDLITTMLGYPQYMIPFLGVAKVLGVIGIIVPGFPRVREWAYAGLFFDLIGATYSAIAVEGLMVPQLFMVLPFGFGALSYMYAHKMSAGK